jgi:unsaturated rhamnogalacturonyl hydrolase
MSSILRETADRLYSYMIGDHQGNWGMDIDHWDWVPGVGITSMLAFGRSAARDDVIQYVQRWVERNKGKADLAKVINSMAPYAVFPDLYTVTGNSWYLDKSNNIARWMLEEAPRTREGAFEHTVTENAQFPEQVWADTVYMAVLFLARLAGVTKERSYAEEALRQTLLHLRLLQDPDTGLLFHGWNSVNSDHLSAVRWARANAWITLAVPQIILEVKDIVKIPEELYNRYKELATGLRDMQSEDGLWHTVLDKSDTYKETSGSAGIACGFILAVRGGLLDSAYSQTAERTLKGVLPLITSQGMVTGVSGGTPIMPSVEAYNQIELYPTQYGQGLTLQLVAESLV